MSRIVDVTITYLRQDARPVYPPLAAGPRKTAIMRVERPPVHFYRYLYDLIGRPYFWVSRKRLSDAELAEIIHDERDYLYVLYVGGAPAGMAEIDHRSPPGADIRFFGVAKEFHGLGLGRFFLANTVDLAWSLGPECVRLETCTLDHPAALPLYQKMGFTVFDQRQGQVELLDSEIS